MRTVAASRDPGDKYEQKSHLKNTVTVGCLNAKFYQPINNRELNLSEKGCIFADNKLTVKQMARLIKDTPILFGSDGRRFEERMQNPPKVTPEKRAEIRRSYEAVIKMMSTDHDR